MRWNNLTYKGLYRTYFIIRTKASSLLTSHWTKWPPFRIWRMHFHEWFFFSIRFSLKFVPKGPIDNKPALAQVMAWRRIGDTPLSGAMLTRPTDVYMRHYGGGGGWGVVRCETICSTVPLELAVPCWFSGVYLIYIMILRIECNFMKNATCCMRREACT